VEDNEVMRRHRIAEELKNEVDLGGEQNKAEWRTWASG
jgi:hypothetical protein